MGNHEYEFLEQPHETPLFHKLHQEIGPESLTWLQNRPLFIETEDFLAVHAGIFPGHHPALTPARVLLNIRTVNPDLGFHGPLSDPANKPWHSFYQGKPVFYGHWARQGLHIAAPAYGLDSGCVYGRQLSAWIFETGELVQVQAKEHYYKKPYDSTVADS
jgi:diadenosine tetraphosphatase ApaH/serine/threonine PP2A family protein phosphatase